MRSTPHSSQSVRFVHGIEPTSFVSVCGVALLRRLLVNTVAGARFICSCCARACALAAQLHGGENCRDSNDSTHAAGDRGVRVTVASSARAAASGLRDELSRRCASRAVTRVASVTVLLRHR